MLSYFEHIIHFSGSMKCQKAVENPWVSIASIATGIFTCIIQYSMLLTERVYPFSIWNLNFKMQ